MKNKILYFYSLLKVARSPKTYYNIRLAYLPTIIICLYGGRNSFIIKDYKLFIHDCKNNSLSLSVFTVVYWWFVTYWNIYLIGNTSTRNSFSNCKVHLFSLHFYTLSKHVTRLKFSRIQYFIRSSNNTANCNRTGSYTGTHLKVDT